MSAGPSPRGVTACLQLAPSLLLLRCFVCVVPPCCCCCCCHQDLEDLFGPYGRIMDIRLNRDRMTGRCKGYAFVAMSREEEVDECIRRLDRFDINGYRITVERAKTDR